MTNYITGFEFSEITGVTGEEIGERGSDSTIRDARIGEAQKSFETECGRTFVGTENDYNLAQRAVAFLTAHMIRLRKIELVPSTPGQKMPTEYLDEYKRLLNIIRTTKSSDDRPVFSAGFDNVGSEDLSSTYQRDNYVSP